VFRLLKYGFIIWLFGVGSGVAVMLIAFCTDWWQQLGMLTLNFHLVNPWLFLIYVGFAAVATLFYRRERKKRIKQEQRRKFLEEHVLPTLKEERK